MIKAEQVPDAASFALDEARRDPDASPWDLIAAAINAWPGMHKWGTAQVWHQAAIVLPLPTENTNADA